MKSIYLIFLTLMYRFLTFSIYVISGFVILGFVIPETQHALGREQSGIQITENPKQRESK